MPTEFCPDCEMPIRIAPRSRIGQRLTCPHCNASLEVTEVSPLELDWVSDKQRGAMDGVENSMATGAGKRSYYT
jgi:hypothetical protein